MGRSSLKEQRVNEILDALEICILRDGLQNTSLEAIASQANMKRSILRHYIGNKDDIIVCLSDRWHQRQIQQWNNMLARLPKENQLSYIINYLFDHKSSKEQYNDFILGDSIFFEIKHNLVLKQQVKKYIDIFVNSLANQIHLEFSSTSLNVCESISYGIYSLYFSGDYFTGLDFNQSFVKNFKSSVHLILKGAGICLE